MRQHCSHVQPFSVQDIYAFTLFTCLAFWRLGHAFALHTCLAFWRLGHLCVYAVHVFSLLVVRTFIRLRCSRVQLFSVQDIYPFTLFTCFAFLAFRTFMRLRCSCVQPFLAFSLGVSDISVPGFSPLSSGVQDIFGSSLIFQKKLSPQCLANQLN